MSFVQSRSGDAGGASNGTTIAFSGDNAATNTLIFAVRAGGDTVIGVSDSQGNANWQEDVHQIQADDGSCLSVWSCRNCEAGPNTVQFTFVDAVTSRFAIAEYDGLLTAANFDVKTSGQSGSSGSTSPASSTATPTTAQSLVLGVISTGGSGATISAGAGYTLREAASASNRLGLEDKAITGTSAQSATFTLGAPGDTYNIATVIYKAAGTGVSGSVAAAESGADTFAATGGAGVNGVRLTLRDTDTGALAADLTGLIVSIRAASNSGSVLAGSAAETTDGDGVLELASTAIGDPGDYVYVTVEKSDNSIVATYRVQVVDLNA